MDEISLVSPGFLSFTDLALQTLIGGKTRFGGACVISYGDFRKCGLDLLRVIGLGCLL